MPELSESSSRAEAAGETAQATSPESGPSGAGTPNPVSDAVAQLEAAGRKVRGRLEQARDKVRHDLAHKNARIEEDIEAEEAETEHLHEALKENDVKTLDLLRVNQETGYDAYANSTGPTSTRPFGE